MVVLISNHNWLKYFIMRPLACLFFVKFFILIAKWCMCGLCEAVFRVDFIIYMKSQLTKLNEMNENEQRTNEGKKSAKLHIKKGNHFVFVLNWIAFCRWAIHRKIKTTKNYTQYIFFFLRKSRTICTPIRKHSQPN